MDRSCCGSKFGSRVLLDSKPARSVIFLGWKFNFSLTEG